MRQQVIKKLSWDYLLARFMKIVGNNLIVILISFKKKNTLLLLYGLL